MHERVSAHVLEENRWINLVVQQELRKASEGYSLPGRAAAAAAAAAMNKHSDKVKYDVDDVVDV